MPVSLLSFLSKRSTFDFATTYLAKFVTIIVCSLVLSQTSIAQVQCPSALFEPGQLSLIPLDQAKPLKLSTDKSRSKKWLQTTPEYQEQIKGTRWTVELKNLPKIKDQCQLGVCHALVWLDYIEYLINKPGLVSSVPEHEYIELDEDFLKYKHLVRASESAVKSGVETGQFSLNLGSKLNDSWSFIGKVGLVPKGVYNWEIPFDKKADLDRIKAILKNIIAKARFHYMKEEVELVRKSILQEAQDEVRDFLETSFGMHEKLFSFRGEILDSKSFLRLYAPYFQPKMQMTNFIYDPALEGQNIGGVENSSFGKVYHLNRNDLERIIKYRMANMGQPLPLNIELNSALLDMQNSVFTIHGWEFAEKSIVKDKSLRKQLGVEGEIHSLLIVGYQEDPSTQKIIRLLVKNSWGPNSGKNGYFAIDMDYFYEYSRTLTIPGEPMLPLPKMISI